MKNKAPGTPQEDGTMSLSGHLKELRNRIIVVLAVFVVGIVVCFQFAEPMVNLLTDLGSRYDYQFVYLRPQELLMVYFSLSIVGALVVAFPVIAYEAFAFISPGLHKRERSFFALALIFGTVCFCLGVYFAYRIMLPFMLRFLISFSHDVAVSASVSIQEYVSFLLLIFIIFGIIFELPVISVLLTSLGLIRPEWLVKARKLMIVLIFVLAAFITPPDIVSQIMVAIPILFLYELSIWLSRLVWRLRAKKEDAEDEEE